MDTFGFGHDKNDNDSNRTKVVNGSPTAVNFSTAPTTINAGQDDEMIIQGYALVPWRQVLTWIVILFTVGFLRLVFFWKPEWFLWCTHETCGLHRADQILLEDKIHHEYFVEDVIYNSKSQEILPEKYFFNKKIKYIWNIELQQFVKLRGLEVAHKCSFYHEHPGYTEAQQELRRQLYGPNTISVRVTPIIKLLFTEALSPFYIFQLFSVILWFTDDYVYYAGAILLLSIISMIVTIYVTRSMQRSLKRTIDSVDVVNVYRLDKDLFEKVTADQLVPGDIIEIPRNGCTMLCDAVLVVGNCIVNEGMLTGESVPVTKAPVPYSKMLGVEHDQEFSMKEHNRHVLFCGTKVIQARFYASQKVKAIVIRTGFSTAKGELVRSILFPNPTDFRFTRDSYKFIGILAFLAMLGMAYAITVEKIQGVDTKQIITNALDLITIAVPPALPAAMTVGVVAAQRRLQKYRIYCITTNNINQSGVLNVVCFDKTGTLTEDGLDLQGIVRQDDSRNLMNLENDPSVLPEDHFLYAMATCHSLTYIEGVLSGDPLDIKMFQATGWEFEEPGEEDTSRYETFVSGVVRPKILKGVSQENITQVGILKQFTFSSKLQRMSVITSKLGRGEFELYAKGAPEMIASLCRPETVPTNFQNELQEYTKRGYRVIGLAWRPLPSVNYVKAQRMERQELEKDLDFLGLLVMENRVKPETTPVIQELRCADIRLIMVTGDNILTALSVAKECLIITPKESVEIVQANLSADEHVEIKYLNDDAKIKSKPGNGIEYLLEMPSAENKEPVLAMTGSDWGIIWKHAKEELPQLLRTTAVFARMSPEQKQQLVEELQALGYYVGMCGDGANDCGALKTAHAGISLSEAEASVAAPFTSKEPNISCVPRLIKEGRASITTGFGIFKYMACYSLSQFIGACFCYWLGATLTQFGFLYEDLIIVLPLFVTFSFTSSFNVLIPKPPDVSLMSFRPVLSMILHTVIMILAQLAAWYMTITQPWFEPYNDDNDPDGQYQSQSTTVIMQISWYQTIFFAWILSIGPPYRKRFYTNYYFLANLLIITTLTVYINMYPAQWLIDWLQLIPPTSMKFRAYILGIGLGNFLISYFVEDCIDLIAERLFDKNQKGMKVLQKQTYNDETTTSSYTKKHEYENPAFIDEVVNDNHHLQQEERLEDMYKLQDIVGVDETMPTVNDFMYTRL